MYKNKKVSIVLPTYREKKSIKRVINSFFKTGFVDEVVIVNNNAEPGTDLEVKKTKAKIIYEKRQGYAYAFKAGLLSAKGYYVICAEPDGTFLGKDLERFLVYAKDFDVVLGSRTSLIPSLSVSGMGVIRKFANVLEAKTIEVLFNTNALTDVGCAYKLFTRPALNKIKRYWKIKKSPLFNTELILITVSKRILFVEVPVTYLKRVGKSMVVGNDWLVFKWAVIIQVYIIYFWINWLIKKTNFR